jgi:hypothetical protein
MGLMKRDMYKAKFTVQALRNFLRVKDALRTKEHNQKQLLIARAVSLHLNEDEIDVRDIYYHATQEGTRDVLILRSKLPLKRRNTRPIHLSPLNRSLPNTLLTCHPRPRPRQNHLASH